MNTIKRILLIGVCAVMAVATGCMHNDGDIGPLFGLWAMDGATIDGESVDAAALEQYYWRFQTDIVVVTHVLPYDDFVDTQGTWTRQGELLTLNFDHDGHGAPAPALGMEPIMHMRIVTETNTRLRLQYTTTAGKTVVYALRKVN